MVRFFATKYKIANETLTSWPVNGPKSKNTCHEVLGSLERVFLERSGSVLLYVPECFSWNVPEVFSLTFRVQSLQRPEDKLLGIPEVIFRMFRKSSSGILEVDVISRVFRRLSPGYFGKYFLGMFRKCSPGMFRKVFSWNVP